MENQNNRTTIRIGAYTALIGALCMITGAVLWGVSGADIEKALYNDDIANYLINAKETYMLVIANLSFWIIGVTLIGVAGTMITAVVAIDNVPGPQRRVRRSRHLRAG